jgi:hypothetical protein
MAFSGLKQQSVRQRWIAHRWQWRPVSEPAPLNVGISSLHAQKSRLRCKTYGFDSKPFRRPHLASTQG